MSTLRHLDLNLIKVFDAIYKTGSVSGAARMMGMSQPSISRGLGRLREHFDNPLFERSGNGVAPTPKAEAMLDSVKSALQLLESTVAENSFDPAADKRHFRMLLPDIIEALVMPGLLNSLPKNSRLTFEALGFSDVEDFRKAISDGAVDVGMIPFLSDEPDLVYRHILRGSFVLVARKGHPLLTEGFLWPLLQDLQFIVLTSTIAKLGRLKEVLDTQSLSLAIRYTTHKLSSIPLLVSKTDLVAFSEREYALGLSDNWDIDIFELPGLESFTQDVYLAHSKQAESDPAIAWLCAQIMHHCQSEGLDKL